MVGWWLSVWSGLHACVRTWISAVVGLLELHI